MNPLRSVVAMLTLSVLAVGCAGTEESETTDVGPGATSVQVVGGAGDVTVDGDASPEGAMVTVLRSDTGEDAEVSIELGDDGVIRVSDDCGGDEECVVGYLVELDGPADVDIVTTGGDVLVRDTTGSVTVDSGGGEVALTATDGTTEVTSGGGGILATQIVAAESVFESGGGDADVTLDDSVDSVSITTEGGGLTVQLPGGPYAIDADTGGGALDVLVDESADSASTATLRSGGGDITVYRR